MRFQPRPMTLSVTLFKVDCNSPALRPSGMTHICGLGMPTSRWISSISSRHAVSRATNLKAAPFSQNAVSTSGFSRSSRLVPEFANFGLTLNCWTTDESRCVGVRVPFVSILAGQPAVEKVAAQFFQFGQLKERFAPGDDDVVNASGLDESRSLLESTSR